MIDEPPVDTSIFPDMEREKENDGFISSQEFYATYIYNEAENTDGTATQTSDSETDGNASGVEIIGKNSDTEWNSEFEQEMEDSTTETDSDMEAEKMHTEKKKGSTGKGADRDERGSTDDYFYNDSEDEGFISSADIDGLEENVLLEDFKEDQRNQYDDEDNEEEFDAEEERHKWRLAGEFSVDGVRYRSSDYVEATGNTGEGTIFYHIQRISIDDSGKNVECKCYRLYRPCETILKHVSRYCNFKPNELFLYYPDERSCCNVIQGNSIVRKITVQEIIDNNIPDDDDDDDDYGDTYFVRFKYHPRDFVFESLYQGRKESITEGMKVLDIFSGCGGLSEGFNLAGFKVNWAIDIDLGACCTNSLRHPQMNVINGDVVDVLKQIKVISRDPKSRELGNVRPLDSLVSIPKNDIPQNASRKLPNCTIVDHKVEGSNKELRVKLSTSEWKLATELSADLIPKLMDYYISKGSLRQEISIEDLFKMDRIHDVRVHEGVKMYKVTWQHCGDKGVRWMPESRITNRKLITRFYAEARFKIPRKSDVDIIIGGPPLYDISRRAKLRGNLVKDPRNKILDMYIDYVRYFRPKVAIFESLCGIFKLGRAALLRKLMGELVAMGYSVRCGVLQAAFYGVPHNRWQVFVIASRFDVALPHFPEPTHWCSCFLPIKKDFQRMIVVPIGDERDFKDNVTVYDAIFDLPENAIPAPERNKCMHYAEVNEERFTEYTKFVRKDSVDVKQHVYMESWKALMIEDSQFTQLGPDKERPPEDQSRSSLKRQFEGKHPLAWGYPFPSFTGRTHALFHPSQKRLLTIREYARAQSFDDKWYFVRKPSSLNEFYQIGDAVPPLLAKAVAEKIISYP